MFTRDKSRQEFGEGGGSRVFNNAARSTRFSKIDRKEGRGSRKPRNVGEVRARPREEAPADVYLGESPCRMRMTLTIGAGISVG